VPASDPSVQGLRVLFHSPKKGYLYASPNTFSFPANVLEAALDTPLPFPRGEPSPPQDSVRCRKPQATFPSFPDLLADSSPIPLAIAWANCVLFFFRCQGKSSAASSFPNTSNVTPAFSLQKWLSSQVFFPLTITGGRNGSPLSSEFEYYRTEPLSVKKGGGVPSFPAHQKDSWPFLAVFGASTAWAPPLLFRPLFHPDYRAVRPLPLSKGGPWIMGRVFFPPSSAIMSHSIIWSVLCAVWSSSFSGRRPVEGTGLRPLLFGIRPRLPSNRGGRKVGPLFQ